MGRKKFISAGKLEALQAASKARWPQHSGNMTKLPCDLLPEVCHHLSRRDAARLLAVSKDLRAACRRHVGIRRLALPRLAATWRAWRAHVQRARALARMPLLGLVGCELQYRVDVGMPLERVVRGHVVRCSTVGRILYIDAPSERGIELYADSNLCKDACVCRVDGMPQRCRERWYCRPRSSQRPSPTYVLRGVYQ